MELSVRSSTRKQTIEININFEVLDEKYQDGVLKVEREFGDPQTFDFSPKIEIIHEVNQAPNGQKCVKVGLKNVKDINVDFGDPNHPDEYPQAQNFEVVETYKRKFNGEKVWCNEKTSMTLFQETLMEEYIAPF